MSIHNLVRGLTHPYAGAHFKCDGREIKVWRSELEMKVSTNLEPGKVLEVSESEMLIKTGQGGIRLKEIEPNVEIKVGDYL